MINIDSLNILNSEIEKPNNLELTYYLFWEKGIDYNRFNKLPIPYILTILKCHNYIKEQEQKELEKNKYGK